MFDTGFLGTKAPMFMDIVTLIVVLLPFLLFGSIYLVKIKKFELHKQTQIALFIITILVIIFFEVGVRVDGGIKKYMLYSNFSDSFIVAFLTFHITIASIAIAVWGRLLYLSLKAWREGNLIGNFSAYHKRLANITTISIVLTSITGFGLYYILFLT